MTHHTTSTPARTPWAGVVTLGLGIFMMTTMEELPIGVLTLVADEFAVANGTIGLSVTVPGFLAGVIAVLAPGMLGRVERRILLCSALLASALSGALSAFAPTVEIYLASRIFVGFGLGVFWAMLGATVARIARPGDLSKALTIAFSGSGAALVLGIPFATWLGTTFGWREAFGLCAIAVTVIAIAVVLTVPRVSTGEPLTFRDTLEAIKLPGVQFAVLFTLIVVTSQFTAYTYASPLLQGTALMTPQAVAGGLLAYGVAGLIGNFLAAPLLSRSVTNTLFIMTAGMAIGVGCFLLFVHNPLTGYAVMVLWGLFAGMVSVVSQAWVLAVAPHHPEAASGLNSGAFNLAIGLGALVGGVIDGGGLAFTGIPTLAGGLDAVVLAALAGLIVASAMALAVRRMKLPARTVHTDALTQS